MAPDGAQTFVALKPDKFVHPTLTIDGKDRATVPLSALRTLWFNTGTLCNLTCRNCYIESSPTNDRLEYLTIQEVTSYLNEAADLELGTTEIGFTGGEPFMNPDLLEMAQLSLNRGFKVIILTNAMRPMFKVKDRLHAVAASSDGRLTIRVSLDHYTPAGHEAERGPRSWQPAIEGVKWLTAHGIPVHVAGRTFMNEDQATARAGYQKFFLDEGLKIDADDPRQLVLFPEMNATRDVPEITTACWGILKKSPADVMCASSRMVVKHRGASAPTVVACTLLPYDSRFDLGPSLAAARQPVTLNHPHCARFCVLGGASCSAG